VHRCIQAAEQLAEGGVRATVIDLRSIAPLDAGAVCRSVEQTGRLLVVDEDYKRFGLSGELAAVVMEAGIAAKFTRVAVEDTIPFDRRREVQALPNVAGILDAASKLVAR
jgi:pyruvate dehydrogenase E1 component beta subunit